MKAKKLGIEILGTIAGSFIIAIAVSLFLLPNVIWWNIWCGNHNLLFIAHTNGNNDISH